VAAFPQDDVYHFISYVAVGNQVFELDGLKRAPVLLGEVPESGEWYSVAREAINRRISQFVCCFVSLVWLRIRASCFPAL